LSPPWGFKDGLSPDDLLRDFSESPGAQGTPWAMVLSDTSNGCLADSGVNEKSDVLHMTPRAASAQ